MLDGGHRCSLGCRIGGPSAHRFQGIRARAPPARRFSSRPPSCAGPREALCGSRKGTGKMPVRLKKLIGTVLLVLLVIVYALVATMVAVAQLSQSGPLVHLAFFTLTGILWI